MMAPICLFIESCGRPVDLQALHNRKYFHCTGLTKHHPAIDFCWCAREQHLRCISEFFFEIPFKHSIIGPLNKDRYKPVY